METAAQTLGVLGEELATQYLGLRGYKVLIRNYVCPLGEIDVIAKEGGALVFIEVITRSSLGMGEPAESVTFHKRRQITKTAQYYLKRYGVDAPCRFDVVSVLMRAGAEPRLELIRGAFEAGQ